jgi:hypothetical protein
MRRGLRGLYGHAAAAVESAARRAPASAAAWCATPAAASATTTRRPYGSFGPDEHDDKVGRPTTPWVRQVISGVDLMRHPKYNKGLAFSEAERDRLYLRGLLPPAVLTQEVQIERCILNIRCVCLCFLGCVLGCVVGFFWVEVGRGGRAFVRVECSGCGGGGGGGGGGALSLSLCLSLSLSHAHTKETIQQNQTNKTHEITHRQLLNQPYTTNKNKTKQ